MRLLRMTGTLTQQSAPSMHVRVMNKYERVSDCVTNDGATLSCEGVNVTRVRNLGANNYLSSRHMDPP